MATYNLTAGNDILTGTAEADTFDGVFSGATGGNDTLSGGGGNDNFILDGSGVIGFSAGTIDGGIGTDTVTLHDTVLGTATFTNVEILDLVGYSPSGNSVWASVSQLSAFTSIVNSAAPIDRFAFNLDGGGTIDFSTRVGTSSVHVSGLYATGGLAITGTAKDDIFEGSNFDDALNGGDGADEFYITGGGIDTLSGGKGNDIFSIGYGLGSIDGGDGIDVVSGNISEFALNNIEVLEAGYGSFVTFAQLSSFETITSSLGSSAAVEINLHGAGGTIDFSTLVAAGVHPV